MDKVFGAGAAGSIKAGEAGGKAIEKGWANEGEAIPKIANKTAVIFPNAFKAHPRLMR